MKNFLIALKILFTVLTIAGAIYVIVNKGTVSAGYAVVPAVWGVIIQLIYLNKYGKKN